VIIIITRPGSIQRIPDALKLIYQSNEFVIKLATPICNNPNPSRGPSVSLQYVRSGLLFSAFLKRICLTRQNDNKQGYHQKLTELIVPDRVYFLSDGRASDAKQDPFIP
jgi:hypothetical protein